VGTCVLPRYLLRVWELRCSLEILTEGMGTCVLPRYLLRVWELRCSLEILIEGVGTCVLRTHVPTPSVSI
jgi:NADH:ubiquinone oxidoreductase subunit D